jgi:hypothetical protein
VGCDGPVELRPKNRPANVPVDAIWAGGADGGAYIKCSVDSVRHVDSCSVWNDFTGESTGPHDYLLVKEHRAAMNSELQYTGAGGGSIFLQNGLVLQSR